MQPGPPSTACPVGPGCRPGPVWGMKDLDSALPCEEDEAALAVGLGGEGCGKDPAGRSKLYSWVRQEPQLDSML